MCYNILPETEGGPKDAWEVVRMEPEPGIVKDRPGPRTPTQALCCRVGQNRGPGDSGRE